MSTGDRMRTRRKELNIPAENIAEYLGISAATVYRYEKGDIEKVPGTILEPLAKILRTTPAYLMGWEEESPTLDDLSTHKTFPITIRIPVLGSVPAGIPIEAVENMDWEDWEEIPSSWLTGDREYFGLKVQGDSMYPKYLDKDTVIVRKSSTCNSGDDCIVYVNGYDATLKTIILNEDGSMELRPKNPEYSPRTYTSQEVADLPVSICGVVVELRRKI